MTTLSVLITYHNEKELLTRCLESLLSQLNAPEEILIYDDASRFPARDFIPKDARIRIIEGEKNVGPSKGRNTLLHETKGEYIHFHDADDWFSTQWVEKVRSAMEKNPDAVYTEVSSFTQEERLVCEKVVGLMPLENSQALTRFCIRHYMLVPAGTFRKDLVLKVGGYRESLWQSEDFDFNVRLALRAKNFVILREPLVYIRLRKESRSRDKVETNTFAYQAILFLEKELPKELRRELAEKSSEIGAELFRLGEKTLAKEVFETARRLGPATFQRERKLYRLVARLFGQESAENIGNLYRKYTPGLIRRLVH